MVGACSVFHLGLNVAVLLHGAILLQYFNIGTYPSYEWHKHRRQMHILQEIWEPPSTSREAKASHSDKSLKSHQELT